MLEQTDALHAKLDALMGVVRPVVAHRDELLAANGALIAQVAEAGERIAALTDELNQFRSERIDLTAAIQAIGERLDEATAGLPPAPAAG